jgi:hypothetical protein
VDYKIEIPEAPSLEAIAPATGFFGVFWDEVIPNLTTTFWVYGHRPCSIEVQPRWTTPWVILASGIIPGTSIVVQIPSHIWGNNPFSSSGGEMAFRVSDGVCRG